jgi:hypothetical protein
MKKASKSKTTKTHGLALDIDETLSWTMGYWVKELQRLFGNPENLTIEELIKKYKYTQDVPYWQTKEALDWMEAQRENDGIQTEFDLIENSNQVVQKINKIVPIVAYITVRPESVLNGTKLWLKKHDFPQAEIIARPKNIPHKDGNKWKAEVLEQMYPQVSGIIDDNPKLLEFLSEDYKGQIYLYDSENVDKKYNQYLQKPNIHPCRKWEDVYKIVTEKQSKLNPRN